MKMRKIALVLVALVCCVAAPFILFGLYLVAIVTLIGPPPIPSASDYVKKLPNGYSLMRSSRGRSTIRKDSRYAGSSTEHSNTVGPSTYGILMAVSGRYVVGNLDTGEEAHGVPEIPDKYFIIDTRKKITRKDLSFERYAWNMHELGFEELPELIRPNKHTQFPTNW